MTKRNSHPDLVELEALRTGEAKPETARHVEECAACRAALHDMTTLAGELPEADATVEAAPEIDVPEAIDRRMLALARTRAAEVRSGIDRADRRRRILTPLRALAGAAVAAAVLVAAGVFTLTGTRAPVPEADHARGAAAQRMDVDASGTVDIVDAYLMSRRIKRGAAQASWDFDLDGAVTERDVDAVARRAVALADFDGGI